MNISKLKLAWKFLTGGREGVLDYVLDCWKKVALEILKYSGWLIAIVATLLKVNIG